MFAFWAQLREVRSKSLIQICAAYFAFFSISPLAHWDLGLNPHYSDFWNNTSGVWKGPWQSKFGVDTPSWSKTCWAYQENLNYTTSLLCGKRGDPFNLQCTISWHILSRCLGVLAEKITQNTAIEDKKIKKELQVSIDIDWLSGDLSLSRIIMENCWTHVLYMSEDQLIRVLGSVVVQRKVF